MNQGSPWTIKNLLQVAADFLKEKKVDSPRLTAEILLSHLLNFDRINLYLNFDKPLTESEVANYRSFIKRRVRHEPIQYITGVQEFWSLEFKVDRRVLIPRPESEVLVEQTINHITTGSKSLTSSPKILDIATGCGILAIALGKEIPSARIWATDISSDALALASYNAHKHQVTNKIRFVKGALFEPLKNLKITFDIILSNPPYIATEEYDQLPPEVREWEPTLALNGKKGGLFFIEEIIKKAPDYMEPEGWLLIEMAPFQTEDAIKFIEKTGKYSNITRVKDYSQRYRIIVAQKTRM
jgi:release factor glutamine methyltransferase